MLVTLAHGTLRAPIDPDTAGELSFVRRSRRPVRSSPVRYRVGRDQDLLSTTRAVLRCSRPSSVWSVSAASTCRRQQVQGDAVNQPQSMWPPGHYYSPLPSLQDVEEREDRIFAVPEVLPGIDLREAEQLALVDHLAAYYDDQPFTGSPSEGLRYYYENDYFSYGDGLMLYCMLRTFTPQRVVEIGSGFSSALILDVREHFLPGALNCTFVEPEPDRLQRLMRPHDVGAIALLEARVQEAPFDLFVSLEQGDMLFIDSSHVSKIGSDVNWLFFEILPRLARGVLVHLHDIFYPFEYPKEWVYQGRAWNECYLLRSFLMFNPSYKIRLFNSFLAHRNRQYVAEALPLWARNPGGSIWLERV